MDLNDARRHYAEEVRLAGGLLSDAVVDAFATVPRERFLGPGPWKVPLAPRRIGGAWRYRDTDDADPRHLCHNVLVAIDPARGLNNGQPSFLAFKIEAARIGPADRVVHVGCGVGYYTAIMAELARDGRVIAIEADHDLAERSRINLEPWPNVDVVAGDGTTHDAGDADVIFVNAGATHPAPLWLCRLAEGGRMVLPLTHSKDGGRQGIVLLVERADGLRATAISGISVFDCAGGRDDEWDELLGQALERGDHAKITSIVDADHACGESCWAHLAGICISTA